jgi:hypothetical protein
MLHERNAVMKATKLIPALALVVPAIAAAEPNEGTGFDHSLPAASGVEIAVGTGYSQGTGKISTEMANVQDLSGPGGAAQLDVGYRLRPYLTLGGYGTFGMYNDGSAIPNSTDVYGATAGIQAAYHFRADRSVDPWVRLGTGWKAMWLNPQAGKATSLQGLELARLQVGVDYRITPTVAITPVVGGSMGMFLSQNSQMTNNYDQLTDRKLNFTGFAGFAGTFDIPTR